MIEVALERHARSCRAARHIVTEALARHGAPQQCIDDAALLVSELVSNALLHADGTIRLTCDVDGSMLRVGVSDQEGSRPRVSPASLSRTTGRGLMLLDVLATRWGVVPSEDGKTMWFETDW